MSKLRRPFLYDRYIFVTVNLRSSRSAGPAVRPCGYSSGAGSCRAAQGASRWKNRNAGKRALRYIPLARMRQKQGFVLTAWVFLPDHWRAIIYPPHPLSIAKAMSAIKISSMVAINHGRHEKGELWQERFFDHALRTVKDYGDTAEYIHMNPVRRGLVKRPEEWKWSSIPEYAGVDAAEQQGRCGLIIDRVRLPADENARI